MKKKKDETKFSNQISIRIVDADKWDALQELKEAGKYKSFNALINEFIDEGIERKSNPNAMNAAKDFDEELAERGIDKDSAMFYRVITNLMEEVVLNSVISKSILCSVFQNMLLTSEGNRVDAEAFNKGTYAETPDYLKRFEKMMTDKINKSNKNNKES